MASVNVERTENGYVARNDRGAEVAMGGGDEQGVFTPVELLLAALGGCNIVTVEPLTAKRGHRLVRLAMTVHAEKVETTKLGPITVSYDIELPEGDEQAEEVFRAVAHRVEEKYCTVSHALRNETEVVLELPV
ncbi:osmotically inducible protein C [Planobispora rosea]|uniref:Osmotically inducible protein C n=1 Tax=Planobispora rosea TaxID=35762 RepID=A0A8J3WD10_PLARO|nr:OsmC family protein [Planobispora rosea]GGS59324.1 osmotically inducible protein C [Planobispora rosea]GIH84633.1 osmotically inducible protein C [Planobispora rosea]